LITKQGAFLQKNLILKTKKKSHTEDENFKEVQLGVYGLLFREKYPERSISSLAYYDIKQAELKPLIGKEESIDAYLDNFEKHLINIYLKILMNRANCYWQKILKAVNTAHLQAFAGL